MELRHLLGFGAAAFIVAVCNCKSSGGSGGSTTSGPSTGSSCTPGSIACACNTDGTCDGKLTCVSKLCTAPLNCGNGVIDGTEQCDNGAMNCDTCACKSDCTLQVCGDGKVGMMEACDNGQNQLTKHGLGCYQCTDVKQVALATDDGTHLCVLISTGKVKCWGSNTVGQLGYGDTMNRGDQPMELGDALLAVNLGTGRTGIEVAVGGGSACAVLDDHSVKCWGDNTYGQLGYGDTKARGAAASDMGDALPKVNLGTGRTAVHIAMSNHHTCAILDNGSVKCWGASPTGELGQGDTMSHGIAAGDMGDSLPAVSLGTGRTAVAIAVGSSSFSTGISCAILDDGNVKCWGNGANGALGQGSTADVGSMPGQMGDALPSIPLFMGQQTASIAVSARHVCARSPNGLMKCWGENNVGQLGQGSTADVGSSSGQMAALQPINLGTNRKATVIATGTTQACAVLDDRTLKCWGGNSKGELGLGDSMTRGVAAGQMGDALTPVNLGANKQASTVFAALTETCSILTSGVLKCWGTNDSGQLGQGDTMTRGLALADMGDNLNAILVP